MVKVRSLFLVIVLIFTVGVLAACGSSGVPEEEVAALEAQLDDLQSQLSAAQQAAADAEAALADAEMAAPEVVTEAATVMADSNTLAEVQSRGVLRCGGNANVPGFGYLDPDTGNFSGFDIDFCRAVAAAVLGNAEAIEVTPTTGQSRFPVLQSGEIDVLSRNTTHTFSRDTARGFDFAPITFYDGQGMMVRRDSGIGSLADMEGATVCVQSGTTTELNLAQYFDAIGVNIDTLVFDEAVATREAYDEGACDGFTTDKSGLVSQQILLANPEDHQILVEDMSREPLGPLTRHGDNFWNDIVSWSVLCTINAEFLGVSQANVDDMLGGDDPVVADLLGETGDLGTALGLSNDFCYQIIKQVGNYADIYNRHLGPDTPFNLPRGLNALYTDGGILYPIPYK